MRRQRSVVLGSVRELGVWDARRLLSQKLAAINQGTHKPELMMTFERFVVERWEPNILPMLRYSTARNYRHMIQRHLTPFFGDLRLPEIGPAVVQKFLAEKSKQLAPWTIHQLRSILSKIFSTAQRWDYLEKNPTRRVQVPSLVNARDKTTLPTEQVRALLGELKEPYRTMVLLAVLSGLRRGEIFGLRWKYVDFEEGSRCTYSTWANPSGESIKALQAQLGHTDSRLTLSVYTQPMPEAQKLLACKISSVLLRSAPKSEVQRGETEVVVP